jgi:hypothetical protein
MGRSVSDFDVFDPRGRSIAAACHRRIQACRLSCRCGSPKYTARLDCLCTVLRTNAGMSCQCDQHLPLRGGRSLMSESHPSRISRLIAGTVCMRWCVWQQVRNDTRSSKALRLARSAQFACLFAWRLKSTRYCTWSALVSLPVQ